MAKLKTYDASSIAEVIVALVIISVVLGISVLLMAKLYRSKPENAEIASEIVLRSSSNDKQIDGFRIIENSSHGFKGSMDIEVQTKVSVNSNNDTVYKISKLRKIE
jgi:hypothetical protein